MSSMKIETFDRDVTTTTRDGTRTEPHRFTRLAIDTGGGVIHVELDAGEWSRALANPGHRVVVALELAATASPRPRAG